MEKLKKIFEYIQLLKFTFPRLKANRIYRNIETDRNSIHSQSVLCEGLWDHPYHWLRVAMLSKAMSESYPGNLIGISLKENPRIWETSLRSIGASKIERVQLNFNDIYLQKAKDYINKFDSVRQLVAARLPGGCPSSHIYDGAIKCELEGEFDISDDRLAQYYAQAFYLSKQYKYILEKINVKAAIVSHPTQIRFVTLIWELINQSIPVYLINYRNSHVTIRVIKEEKHIVEPYDDAPHRSDFRELSQDTRLTLESKGKDYMDLVRKGNESEFARVGVYGDGLPFFSNRKAFCNSIGADPSKPLIIIMGNCWPDFPNSYGPTWYSDYVDWFQTTVRATTKLKKCNWIIKPHPAESEYGEKSPIGKISGEELPQGLFMWPIGATGVDLSLYCEGIVTARGTSAVEYAGAGLRVIVGARTAYTDHGFVKFANSESEYINLLSNIHLQEFPSNDDVRIARMYSAVTFARYDNQLQMPYGFQSQNLYSGIPNYVEEKKSDIESEIIHLKKWVNSGHTRYHTWRVLNSTH